MNKTIEAKGDTIDQAVRNALNQLGCDRDDVTVEVVKQPKSGFLGFGKEPAVVRVTMTVTPSGRARDFLEGLLIRFGTPAHIEVREDIEERAIHLELTGENMGAVIGRRGDTLDAFQYLTGIVANKDEDERWRVTVDTENYRQKREAALEALAKKTAQKALKYNRGVALEPMSPHERRVIHSAIQSVEGVTTYSTGNEPNRRVIIAPEGLPQRTGGQSGGKKQGGKQTGRQGAKGGNRPSRSGGRNRPRTRKPRTETHTPAEGTTVEITEG